MRLTVPWALHVPEEPGELRAKAVLETTGEVVRLTVSPMVSARQVLAGVVRPAGAPVPLWKGLVEMEAKLDLWQHAPFTSVTAAREWCEEFARNLDGGA